MRMSVAKSEDPSGGTGSEDHLSPDVGELGERSAVTPEPPPQQSTAATVNVVRVSGLRGMFTNSRVFLIVQDEHRLSIAEVLSRYGSKVDEASPSKSMVSGTIGGLGL